MVNKPLNIENLFLNLSLYNPVKFVDLDVNHLTDLFLSNTNLQFDCYCVECKKEAIFKFSKREGAPRILDDWMFSFKEKALNSITTPMQISFECQRDNRHKYSFSFRISNFEIVKVGQYPSLASIEISTIQKYRKVLSNDYRDFSKAIGLFSHGVGAGSFVYLRRIFENLIEEKRKEAAQIEHWNEDLYQKSRMPEKINILKDFLPTILVENRQLYSILSKGIHELEEEECLSLFPNVQLAIELILDEKIFSQERERKVKSTSSFIASTMEKLKS